MYPGARAGDGHPLERGVVAGELHPRRATGVDHHAAGAQPGRRPQRHAGRHDEREPLADRAAVAPRPDVDHVAGLRARERLRRSSGTGAGPGPHRRERARRPPRARAGRGRRRSGFRTDAARHRARRPTRPPASVAKRELGPVDRGDRPGAAETGEARLLDRRQVERVHLARRHACTTAAPIRPRRTGMIRGSRRRGAGSTRPPRGARAPASRAPCRRPSGPTLRRRLPPLATVSTSSATTSAGPR